MNPNCNYISLIKKSHDLCLLYQHMSQNLDQHISHIEDLRLQRRLWRPSRNTFEEHLPPKAPLAAVWGHIWETFGKQ